MDIRLRNGEYIPPEVDVVGVSSWGVLCESVFDDTNTTETTPGGFVF